MTSRKRLFLSMAAAFFLPVIVMGITYIQLGIYPFGDSSLLAIDMNNQYIHFFSYLREILKGNHSCFYSFSKTLGGDMIGLSAYYLMSPLNLILLFFSTENLPVAVMIITLIKTGLCGLTFYLCIFEGNRTWHGLIFSSSYALIAYNIIYQQNIMWLDGVILLPLIVWGIRLIFQKKSPLLYIVSLFGAIVTNYYIGFMLCICSVLYFLFYYFFEHKRTRFWDFKAILEYGFSSLLAGGLSMWLVIPTLRSLSGGKAEFSLANLTLHSNFNWCDFFSKLFMGSLDYQQIQSGLPNVYCGMAGLFFLGIFFLNRKIPFKRKAGAFALFLILAASFYVNTFNMIWHGFNKPVWFPYRYSFIFSFLMLFFAWEGFRKIHELSMKEAILISSISAGTVFLAAIWMNHRNLSFMSSEKYILSIVFLVAVAVVFLLYFRKKQSLYLLLTLLICAAELCTNAVKTLDVMPYAGFSDYQTMVLKSESLIDNLKDNDKSFYRTETTYSQRKCDPMLFDFNGLTHYSSTEKTAVKDFMGQAGFRNYGSWAQYNHGSTYAMDSLLGVKYVLSQEELENPYQLLTTGEDVSVYENPYALSLGFLSDSAVLTFDSTISHKFQFQNELWKALDPTIEKDIFVSEEEPSVTLVNLSVSEARDDQYLQIDPEKEGYIEYTFKANSNHPVFGYFNSPYMNNTSVEVNGKLLDHFVSARYNTILRLGTYKVGDTITVKIKTTDDRGLIISDALFYHQDMEVFEKYYDSLSQNHINLQKLSDTKITGTVTNTEDSDRLAFFTIPYEDSWLVYVDGEKVETATGGGIFLTAGIPSGTHEIELRYSPAGLKAGVIITVFCAFVLIIWMILRYHFYRKANIHL